MKILVLLTIAFLNFETCYGVGTLEIMCSDPSQIKGNPESLKHFEELAGKMPNQKLILKDCKRTPEQQGAIIDRMKKEGHDCSYDTGCKDKKTGAPLAAGKDKSNHLSNATADTDADPKLVEAVVDQNRTGECGGYGGTDHSHYSDRPGGVVKYGSCGNSGKTSAIIINYMKSQESNEVEPSLIAKFNEIRKLNWSLANGNKNARFFGVHSRK